MSEIVPVRVPLLNETLVPPPPERVRAFKRHLVRSLRDLRAAKRADRLIQKSTPEPAGFAAAVLRAGCATCGGHCCTGGGEHAQAAKDTQAVLKDAQTAQKIEAQVANESDDEVKAELRKDFRRP